MIVYSEHVSRLDHALRKDEPIVVLPPLHPDYLRRLVLAWVTDCEAVPRVRLFEPGLGSSKLIPKPDQDGGGVLAGCRPCPSVADFLRLLIEEAGPLDASPAGTDLAERPTTIYWLAGSSSSLTDPVDASLLTALCRRIVAYRLPWRLLMDTPDGPTSSTIVAWKRDLELQAPRNEPNAEDMFSEQVLRELSPDLYDTLRKRQEGAERTGVDNVVRKVQGLDAAAINLVLAAAVQQAPRDDDDDETLKKLEEVIEKERGRQLMRASGLEVVLIPSDPEELQGMNRFQRYLDYVSVLFDDSGRPGADGFGPRPRGVLLAGLPGCGKSLAARLAAERLSVPLLRMDVGGMLGRYLGESEANLRRALDAAEAAAPCVLWVDEIEKALGGTGDEGGGTSKRMLGQLLTWMQDHRSQVYIFATANSVANLPPELLRRGRFDELWRVMLPTPEERESILRSKLAGLKQDLDEAFSKDDKAIKEVVKKTEKFTGADITSLVQEAWMAARVFEQKVKKRHLLEVLKRGFVPMSAQFEDEIKKSIADLDKHGFRDVTCPPEQVPPPVPDERKKARGRLVPTLAELWSEMAEGRVVITGRRKTETLRVGPREGGERAVWLARGDVGEWPSETSIPGVMVREGGRLKIDLEQPEKQGKPEQKTIYFDWDLDEEAPKFRGHVVKLTPHPDMPQSDSVVESRWGLETLSVWELRNHAKDLGISGVASKTKSQLLDAILEVRDPGSTGGGTRPASHNRQQLTKLTVPELRAIGRDLGISGVNGMNKSKLIDAITRSNRNAERGDRHKRLGYGEIVEFRLHGPKRIELPGRKGKDAVLRWGSGFRYSARYDATRGSAGGWALRWRSGGGGGDQIAKKITMELLDSGEIQVRLGKALAGDIRRIGGK